MSQRLTPAMRKQIITDFKHGIQNQDYRVIERDDGTFQVRKRTSKFKIPSNVADQQPQPESVKDEPVKEESPRLSNEELLRKLSTLLEIPVQNVDPQGLSQPAETPQEYEQEVEAYEDDQNYIEQNIQSNFNPYMRRPLRLY